MKRNHVGCAGIILPLVGLALYLYLNNGLPQIPSPQTPTPPTPSADQEQSSYIHLRFGNPNGAKADEADKDNYLMEKKYFALSYNNANGTPNWVSWHVGPEDLGKAKRSPVFYPDDTMPAGFKKVTQEDYTGSGFDRGHMCPHGDRQRDDEESKATFVTTNIVPQSPANNEKAWEQLESYCRSLVKDEGDELYVVSGPHGKGGEGKNGFKTTIAEGKVVVPADTWKVVMVLKQGAQPDRNTRLIAVIVPNNQEVGEAWSPYRVSVRAVEQETGYKFFDRVDPAVIEPLKQQVDAVRIPPPTDHGR